MIYQVQGQPYAGLPVFRIASVEEEGKVKIVLHWNVLHPFGRNVEDSENEESWQHVYGLSDFFQAVSHDVEAETKTVSTDPEPEGERYTVCTNYVWARLLG